ncbi:MAG: 4'-phosphopantetheinyl transferase superfamily protein [Clostridia bacterium]|nr:4'-phosphopantetheinyl transferase superfamily protein [Clostridia bacterium]
MIYLAIAKCENNRSSQHETAYSLLDSLLSELGYRDTEIKKAGSGRPYVEIEHTDISVSHSGEAAAVAVISPEEADVDFAVALPFDGVSIGIDIEEITEGSIEKKKRIAERFLKTSIASEKEFYRLWTQNEAYGKMTGEGVLSKKDESAHILTFTLELSKKEYSLSISIK